MVVRKGQKKRGKSGTKKRGKVSSKKVRQARATEPSVADIQRAVGVCLIDGVDSIADGVADIADAMNDMRQVTAMGAVLGGAVTGLMLQGESDPTIIIEKSTAVVRAWCDQRDRILAAADDALAEQGSDPADPATEPVSTTELSDRG